MTGIDAADVRLLNARRARILAKLITIANGATTRLTKEPKAPQYGESRPPAGVRQHMDVAEMTGPPALDLDPHGHFLWRFKADKTYHGTEKVCAQAEAFYARYMGTHRRVAESSDAKDTRILRDYVGQPPWVVATWEDCNPESVRRLRHEAGCDASTGQRREMSDRELRMAAMKQQGASLRTIGEEFGISHERVRQILTAA